jgi:hypothetical protein
VRTIAIALFALTGCIDEFSGSQLQIDFATKMPTQGSPYRAQRADELPPNIHFTLYAFDEQMDESGTTVGRLFEVQQFEIHRIVDIDSPCFIDVGEHVPIPGLHVSQFAAEILKKNGITDLANPGNATEAQQVEAATAVERQENIQLLMRTDESLSPPAGPKAITSVSKAAYGAVASNCTDTNGIPPPECVEPDANQRRLEMCQAVWKAEPGLFEGTDRVLTDPLNGTTFGMVDGSNPINLAPVGGSAFFVEESLEGFDGFAIYWQYDDADGDGMPDYPASVPADERRELGQLYLFGRPEPASRGVIHTHLTSLVNPLVTAELAIFANIDEDDVHF